MKNALKQFLTARGFIVQRLPRGIPTGQLLERDLRLVVGGQPGMVCVDVGANRGDFVDLLLQSLAAPQVDAFEPAPGPFAQLQQRHGRTPGVRLVPAGVADTPGELSLQVFDNEALNSFLPLAPGGGQAFGGPSAVRRQTVPVTTLDAYAASRGLGNIDLLKIDTQGYELHVIRGAAGLFHAGRIRTVLLELNFMSLYAGQAPAHEVISLLQQNNLHLVDFYEKCRKGPFLGWCTALFTHREP